MRSPNILLHTSNRLEILADELACVLGTPLPNPLTPEIIVVQSKGMERWLAMELARRFGVWANCRYPFPNGILMDIFAEILPEAPDLSPFAPESLAWTILQVLPRHLDLPAFAPLKAYVGAEPHGLKAYQLARKIASVFDQYLIFRPEMITGWEQGDGEDWQAILWRALISGLGQMHWPGLRRLFLERVRQPSFTLRRLPPRLAIFGISTLPPFHMKIFDALAPHMEIHLFLLSPCREYWADIVSDVETSRLSRRSRAGNGSPGDLYFEKGNSLLASMGRLGRDFFGLLQELEVVDQEHYVDPREDNLLAALQKDILNLNNRGLQGEEKKILAADDMSVQIHSCHSPMREVEVLRDNLLALLERHPDLEPRDILVMTPDVETYAPFVQAVFAKPGEEHLRLPFAMADRSAAASGRIVETFLSLLDLLTSRFTVTEVFSLLETPAVHQRFALAAADLETIASWLADGKVRWGIDATNRQGMGLPAFKENTWEAGLTRLLLGYALPSRDGRLFMDLAPHDAIEGLHAEVFGNFLAFVEGLFSLAWSLAAPQTLPEWAASLLAAVEFFFLPDTDTEREIELLQRTLIELAQLPRQAGFAAPVELSVVRFHLGERLAATEYGFGFLAGGVTFGTMLPMRSIPFKVICLLGMNDGTYPRPTTRVSFDLMAKAPRRGDRCRRDDDRYLFLEALLSARQTLYISYVGQGIRDNAPYPPSVLVSELLDSIEQGFAMEGKSIVSELVHTHRLQPFSPEYFLHQSRLFSFSQDNLAAARAAAQPQRLPAPFFQHAFGEPSPLFRTVDLGSLCRFFTNPAAFLLRNRLGVWLEEAEDTPAEDEPFLPTALERYGLQRDLMTRRLAGEDSNAVFALMRARGELPHGRPGEVFFTAQLPGVEEFIHKIRMLQKEGPLPDLEVDITLDGFRLLGVLKQMYPGGLIHFRYGKLSAPDRLRLWLAHLALLCATTPGKSLESLLLGIDATQCYRSPDQPRETLGHLLRIYWQGLCRPVPFFPKTSWCYAEALHKGKTSEKALHEAKTAWEGSPWSAIRGEGEDLAFRTCLGAASPFSPEFEELALAIYGPLLACEDTHAGA